MNPFLYAANEIATGNLNMSEVATLSYLCPLWASLWTDEPTGYVNVWQPVLDQIATLEPCPLRNAMEKFVHAQFDRWTGAAYFPE